MFCKGPFGGPFSWYIQFSKNSTYEHEAEESNVENRIALANWNEMPLAKLKIAVEFATKAKEQWGEDKEVHLLIAYTIN